MSEPKNQHWIPKFLLKKWEVAPGKIPTWSLVGPNQKLFLKYYSAETICSRLYLYNMKSESEIKKHRIESDYLQILDHLGSKIIGKIEIGSKLDDAEKIDFVEFIYGLHLRNPETMERMEKYSEEKKIIPTLIEHAYSAGLFKNPIELSDEIKKIITHDAVRIAIGQGAYRDIVYNYILEFTWHFIKIDESSHSLPFIISDQPLVLYNGLMNPDSEIFLPLGPRLLFWATRKLNFDPRSLSDSLLSEIANNQQTFYAFEQVFGIADRAFLEKNFAERLRLTKMQTPLP